MGSFDVAPEPTPNWNTSLEKWGLSWDFHIYIFGVLCLMIAIFNFFSLIYHITERKTKSKRIFRCYVSINGLLLFYNFSRGLILLLDPYNSNVNDLSISQGVAFIFWGSTVPCFTSAFMLMNLALLEVTKVQLYSTRVENLKLIFTIIAMNFTLVLGLDFTAVLKPELSWFLHICRAFFMILGFLLALLMLYTGTSILRKLRESAQQISQFDCHMPNEPKQSSVELELIEKRQNNKGSVEDILFRETYTTASDGKKGSSRCAEKIAKCAQRVNWKSKAFRKGTFRLTIITIVTSVAAIFYSFLQVYSFIAVYDVRDSTKPIHSWHWFIYQTLDRLCEVVMSIAISYIVRVKDVFHWCRGFCGI